MNANFEYSFKDEFAFTNLPVVNKRVLRMGVAGNYGIDSDSIRWAADQGVNYWLYGNSFKKITEGIRDVINKNREEHIVAHLGWGYFGGQIRKRVEKALRQLNTEYLDVYKLSWLSKSSFYNSSTIKTLLQLKKEGKIKAIGTSIHDRIRAGRLAQDSEIDVFMIRYNAKHPGAEQDIFPHLAKRNPAVVSYTALAWQQLIKPLKTTEIRPWPGSDESNIPPLTPELCYRFVLSNPNVHVVLTGPKNQEQLAANLKVLEKDVLSPEELQWVRDYGQLVRSKKRMDYI